MISRIVHRHSDLKDHEPDLVLEVGKLVPPFYQTGRRRGRLVTKIEGVDPVICTLDDGDVIFIGGRAVRAITHS
jgi:hypothetical protein